MSRPRDFGENSVKPNSMQERSHPLGERETLVHLLFSKIELITLEMN